MVLDSCKQRLPARADARYENDVVAGRPSPGPHRHSTSWLLAGIACHALAVYTLILPSLFSVSVKTTARFVARPAAAREHLCRRHGPRYIHASLCLLVLHRVLSLLLYCVLCLLLL